ncbi:MAG TPA: SPFH domain-containing protein [Rhizomicrobium sp.]|nr:SPFH domain-containing protein [Rhizomicrobium sp.]
MGTQRAEGAKGAPRPELLPGLSLLISAAALVVAVFYRKTMAAYASQLGLELAAPLLLAAGGFLSNYVLARAKQRGTRLPHVFVRRGAKPLPKVLELTRTGIDRARIWVANTDWTGDWLPLGLIVITCLATLYLAYRAWVLAAIEPGAIADQWLFGGLIAVCFPLLVLERRIATLPDRRILGRTALTMLLRLLLLNILLFAVSYLLRWLALPYWRLLEQVALLMTALVAAEILLRNASYLFMPLPPLEQRPGRCESLLASLLELKKPSLSAMSASVSHQFGIDLSRSWALGFIRRASLPSLIGLVIAGWLMTGVTALDLSQRAVYESFGQPQAVFHSGLHIHLPWPLGRLKLLEYGAVREIPIVFPSEAAVTTTNAGTEGDEEEGSPVSTLRPTPPTIEGPPPDSADRLWDASHPSEASFLVASNRNGQETFEIVNIDIQILYRVGLSDAAALSAAYSVENPQSLIRAAAGRMLARYFARYTIPDVLGQNRERFVREFQQELQGRLNALSAGLDILGVVIEAIHPPADAATAYQDVQAAGIRSETAVATARGDAVTLVVRSHQEATTMRDDATATGAEMIDQAKADTALFAGDIAAYHRDGAAFLFERRLSAIGKAITPSTPVTILDSHIAPALMPTLDLRPAGSASTPPPSGPGGDND